mgnify:CR=1 FL=1
MKIVVLAGGLSPERDVSLSSGGMIANALREAGHRVVMVDVYEGIQYTGETDRLFEDKTGTPYSYKVPDKEPDLDEIRKRNNNRKALIGPNVISLCEAADIVFIALHGAMGENGQLQAVFDTIGIRYTGTGYIGCLLAMDKDIAKRLMRQAGIPTADWTVADQSVSGDYIIETVGLPCVVKPCSAGSSIGVSIVEDAGQLNAALDYARSIEKNVLVEKMVKGREFSVGILGGSALPVIEIIPGEGFYDYKNKYQAGLAREICPARLSEENTRRLQDLALKVHHVLRLGSYSRIDFIMSEEGEFFCLEANTLPGMTPTSLLPQEALAVGISYVELCDRIVRLGFGKD